MKWLPILFGMLLVDGSGLVGQEPSAKSQPSQREVLATVNDYSITNAARGRWLRKKFPNLATSPRDEKSHTEMHPTLVNGALQHLIDRRVVFEYLAQQGLKISADETRLELEGLIGSLERMGLSWEDYLRQEGISQSEFEFELQWELAWRRYLEKVLSDEYLQQHFARHRRRFDRSEMRVAHLLIKVTESRGTDQALELAGKIHGELLAGQLSRPASDAIDSDRQTPARQAERVADSAWEAAVLQYSDAPSKQTGGEVGWIRFHEPMPEAFAAAAFDLQPGQVSRPVKTAFGVHLIRCLELREGKMGWRDARLEVQDHAAKTLFEKIAKQYRHQVSISKR